MKKEIIIFLITYIIVSLIRGLILFSTGLSFNIFQDKFEFIPFIIDLTIWILSYMGVRWIITRFTKNKSTDTSEDMEV